MLLCRLSGGSYYAPDIGINAISCSHIIKMITLLAQKFWKVGQIGVSLGYTIKFGY